MSRADTDRIETMLDEIEENLRGAKVAETTTRTLELSARKLREAIATWRAEPPSAEMVAEIAEAVADVLEQSRKHASEPAARAAR